MRLSEPVQELERTVLCLWRGNGLIAAASRIANEAALRWLDSWSEHDRNPSRERPLKLVSLVRTEVVFEMELTEGVENGPRP